MGNIYVKNGKLMGALSGPIQAKQVLYNGSNVEAALDELNADKLDKYEQVAVSASGKTFAQQLSELYTTWQTLPVERKMRAFLKINMSTYNIVNMDTGLFSTCSLDASHHYITQFDFGTGHFYISTDNSVSDSSSATNNYSMELYA